MCVTGSRTQERSGRTVGGVTEQQPYEVLERFDGFELRRYPPHLVAEVELDGSFEDAGNRAFRRLFAYITGQNEAQRSVAMTAPVVQAGSSENVAMTGCDADPIATASAFMNMWMNSQGHKDNILRQGLQTLGVGMSKGSGMCYGTQDFGSR